MRLILPAFAALALAMPLPALAGPSVLEGSWSGGGYVHPTNGQREKVSCRVTYHQTSETVHGPRLPSARVVSERTCEHVHTSRASSIVQ